MSKHDSNNIEIKIDIPFSQRGAVYGLEIAVFFPKSIRTQVHTKQELWSDFDSRARLQVEKEDANSAHTKSRFHKLEDIESVMTEIRQLSAPNSDTAALAKNVQNLGILITDWFSIFFAQQTSALNSAGTTTVFEELCQDLGKFQGFLIDIRAFCEQLRYRDVILARNLADYVHFNLVKGIGSLRAEFDKMRETSAPAGIKKEGVAKWTLGQTRCQQALDFLQADQAKYLYSSTLLQPPQTPREHEEYIIRVGNLKKFFHAPSFIAVSKKEGLKKFSELIAIASALLAGAAGAAFQHVSESGSQVGTGGVSIIALAVLLYAFRDRFKDWGKTFLAKKFFSKIPEFEEDLSHKGVRLGIARKWLSSVPRSKLIHHTDRIHAKDRFLINEQDLSDESLLFREEIVPLTKGAPPTEAKQRIHLHHIIRINLRRYQRFMDDSEKSVTFLDETGLLKTKSVQKLYPFIFSLHQSHGSGHDTGSTAPHLFRVLMSKNGIERVEPFSTGSDFLTSAS